MKDRHEPCVIATGLFLLSGLMIVISLPLVFRMVKMNNVYGVRIPEAFQSQERWFQINCFGGVLLFLWGAAMGITGAMGVSLKLGQSPRYALIGAGVFLGGLALVIAAIYVYAAATTKP